MAHVVEKVNLLGLPPEELGEHLRALGGETYRARQVMSRIYRRGARSFGEMSDLPLALRRKLAELASFAVPRLVETRRSADGVRKFLFAMDDGEVVESVLIPEEGRLAACLSTQVGCRMGCTFCRTAGLGLRRDLAAHEIVGQLLALDRIAGAEAESSSPKSEAPSAGEAPDRNFRRVSNVVLMGMGEPLDNYASTLAALKIFTSDFGFVISARRATVSTCGLPRPIRRLGKDCPTALAVSLNAAADASRSRLMPVNRSFPIAEVLRAVDDYPLPRRQRVTLEYILFEGVNDSPGDAAALVRLVHGHRVKVNLIPFNPFPGGTFRRPPDERVAAFAARLRSSGVQTMVRRSRGGDILAACGQLRASPFATDG